MAEVAGNRARRNGMLGPNSGNRTPAERSRERRRRRIQMRRISNAARGTAVSPPGSGSDDSGESSSPTVGGGPSPAADYLAEAAFPRKRGRGVRVGESSAVGGAVPVVGAVAVAGRHREMEDAVTIRTNLCSPTINRCRPVHFFGVYDGHGGPHVAMVCREKLHAILEEELMRVQQYLMEERLVQDAWRTVFSRCFSRTEAVALHICRRCGRVGNRCSCVERCAALCSGSTAVVVVLTQEHIIVANCGDSRAVLSRGGRVVPLSFDHKPDRADEKARIEANGGRIIKVDTTRVAGILAMSRAIGDRYLKPWVISEPELTFTRRDHEADEFVLLASDGLWDVMSSEMSCSVVRECLKEPRRTVPPAADGGSMGFTAEKEGLLPEDPLPSPSASAAALLARLALARKSADNICIVVVDLKRAV